MREEIITFEFDDTELLKEVIDRYNKVQKTGCELRISETGAHELKVINEDHLWPNRAFEVGTCIGMNWMRKNYRLEFTGWRKLIRKELSNNIVFTYNLEFEFEGSDGAIHKVSLNKLAGESSRLEVIRPYIKDADYAEIAAFNEFTKREGWNPADDYAKNGSGLSYIKTPGYLLVFCKTGMNPYYGIQIESIWEIK